jgi:hypothetical protein
MSNPLAARSKAWVCGRSLAGIAVSNPAGAMDVYILWTLFLSGTDRGALITFPEESYRLWWVWVWLLILDNEEVLSH